MRMMLWKSKMPELKRPSRKLYVFSSLCSFLLCHSSNCTSIETGVYIDSRKGLLEDSISDIKASKF
jgi:hypothetical protein